MPHFTIGLGFLILAAQIGWARGFAVVVACHVVLVLPFVLAQRLRLAAQSRSEARACRRKPRRTAGRVLATVTLPLLAPGLVSGWLLAAILSFNEFTASLFVTAQRTQTLPVAMYNYVREYADPSMAALSVMYIVATATLLTVGQRLSRPWESSECRARAAERARTVRAGAPTTAGSDDAPFGSLRASKRFGNVVALRTRRCPSAAASS